MIPGATPMRTRAAVPARTRGAVPGQIRGWTRGVIRGWTRVVMPGWTRRVVRGWTRVVVPGWIRGPTLAGVAARIWPRGVVVAWTRGVVRSRARGVSPGSARGHPRGSGPGRTRGPVPARTPGSGPVPTPGSARVPMPDLAPVPMPGSGRGAGRMVRPALVLILVLIPAPAAGQGVVRNPTAPRRSLFRRRRLPGTPWSGAPRARRLRCAPVPGLPCAPVPGPRCAPGRRLPRCGSRAPGPTAVAEACPTRTTGRLAGIGLPAAPRHRHVCSGSPTRMNPTSCGCAARAEAAGRPRESPVAGPRRPTSRCAEGDLGDPALRQAGAACCSGSASASPPS